jgi:endonuclease/exonuclease/phosphatase (EEP) superfamily protein YafD
VTSDASNLPADPSPSAPPLPEPKAKPGWFGRIISFLALLYLLAEIAIYVFIRTQGDHYWPATIALFAPRWLILAPLILLFPFAVFWRRRALWTLLACLLFAVFPVMGLSIPWRTALADSAHGQTLRVLTCNTHADSIDDVKLSQLIADTHPDVVCLQECKHLIARSAFSDDQWHVTGRGEFLLATRFNIQSAASIPRSNGIRCIVESPSGPITVFCVHLDSPHTALRNALSGTPDGIAELEANMTLRQIQANALAEQASETTGPIVIAGDCNLTTDSPIYRDNLAKFQDAFEFAGFGFGWTYHTLWTITRIDHIMTNSALVCGNCWVGPDVGSPHKPVIAEFSVEMSR